MKKFNHIFFFLGIPVEKQFVFAFKMFQSQNPNEILSEANNFVLIKAHGGEMVGSL